MTTTAVDSSNPHLLDAIEKHWGYTSFRPLQAEAMAAVLSGRDSLIVMPTGGGKSLCYQAPAIVRGALTVVVSPLISLMKDQVDGLIASGVPAAQLNSSQSQETQRKIEARLLDGELRLLFVSPERIAMTGFRRLLTRAGVTVFAIDEAHCISHWGHDFRPEYRQLRELRALFPDASLHAYTATATERVRADIIEQLALREPEVLVGNFDRPNLIYRVVLRRDELLQIGEVIDRHRGEAGIVYCLRRREVDELAAVLARQGHRVVAYHAGLPQDERRRAQDAFTREECDLVVATVAFGMGIDRSNVRFVLHLGLPKSIEHYQQEAGRAGRDGLEAECVLLYSAADVASWKSILTSGDVEPDPDQLRVAFEHLDHMTQYASDLTCRHQALVEHFGQAWGGGNCRACDVCLGNHETVSESLVIAQKILSCVTRLRESWGAGHVISVLRGENLQKIRERGHEQLSTFGILAWHSRDELREWIGQLIAQGFLRSEGTPYPLLKLTAASRAVLRGEAEVRLVRAAGPQVSDSGDESWEGVDRDLFERLRQWRKGEADSRGIPPFVIFHDATLRHLAAVRPSSVERMRSIAGIGEQKLSDYGNRMIALIDDYARDSGASRDSAAPPVSRRKKPSTLTPARLLATEAFRRGESVATVAMKTNRAPATVVEYLAEFIAAEKPRSIDAWIRPSLHEEIATAAARVGLARLKPIFEELEGNVSYDDIRVVVAHLIAKEA